MDKYSQLLERGFEVAHRYIAMLSEHWREHTNRRTLIILVVGGVFLGYSYLYWVRPPDSFPTDELVTVSQGETVSQIGLELERDGVIRSPLIFRIVVTLLGQQKKLHAGDYLFKQPEDVFSIAHSLAIGAYGLEPLRIRIPEGATTKEMAFIFDRQLQRFDPNDFLAKAQPEEGYLFPDTYFFLPNANADTVMQTMRQNFDTQLAELKPLIASSSHSLADTIIMASILEREGRNLQDRRMIAGVLWRRLKLGMALQADATMIYTLQRGEPITPKVLATESPYNTYLHKGLPPTAIGSPSLISLEAAATPIDKGYLFYLADSSGETHFSKTYAGQLANERKYFGR